jgi:uncharacterized membrane protein
MCPASRSLCCSLKRSTARLNRFLGWRRNEYRNSGGIVGGILAICLFAYRFYFNHLWSWDLFAVAMTIVAVKLLAMAWYRVTD